MMKRHAHVRHKKLLHKDSLSCKEQQPLADGERVVDSGPSGIGNACTSVHPAHGTLYMYKYTCTST